MLIKIEKRLIKYISLKRVKMTEQPRQTKRCPYKDCKKKLALTDYACKCNLVYCAAHRADTAHGCTYDWAKENTEKLTKHLPVVVGKKLETL